MKLCIAYCTSRANPEFGWFFDSLRVQGLQGLSIVVIDGNGATTEKFKSQLMSAPVPVTIRVDALLHFYDPKPTPWQGKHRQTKEDWWAVSNARNTAICVAPEDTEYIVWVDDRCILGPEWLQAIRHAMQEEFAICGTYEKRTGIEKINGGGFTEGTLIGSDVRFPTLKNRKNMIAPGGWFFGGTLGMPLPWALDVNGFEEQMDGLGAEDVMMGMRLQNNGYPILYDRGAAIVEDRTPELSGPVMKRTSKERHPNDSQDKGHAAIRKFSREKRSSHTCNLSELRSRYLRGEQFPLPEPNFRDWFDNQLLSEM